MPHIITVTDLRDPALDPYARLTEHQLRSRQEPEKGIFIAESRTVISLALDAGLTPLSFLVEESQLYGGARELLARCGDVPVYTADGALLQQLTGFALSRGVLAVMKRPKPLSDQDVCAGARRIAVLENIMDAGNVGAIIRSAAAMGMDAVLVTPRCSDPLLRRAARVSMGTVFQIPWTVIGNEAADWPLKGMDILAGMGFRTAAMALSDRSVSVADERLKNEERLAILLGTEGTGLEADTIRLADYTVKIPMYHGVDSLNVAAASAVAFWEMGIKK
jgi:tRNA G18 (ribose-2'-O)-methylase SpoU